MSNMEGQIYDVFISHARADYKDKKDKPISGNAISKIKEVFAKEGITFWIDEDGIYSGDEFASIIAENIQNSKVFLFVSSQHSNSRFWTVSELATALAYNKKIIPFRLDENNYDSKVILYLQPLDAINYYANHKQALEKLIRSIKLYINAQDVDDPSSAKVNISTDSDCNLILHNGETYTLYAGKDFCLELSVGTSQLRFESIENPEVFYEKTLEIDGSRIVRDLNVKLLPIARKRKRKESLKVCREKFYRWVDYLRQNGKVIRKYSLISICLLGILSVAVLYLQKIGVKCVAEASASAQLAMKYYYDNDVLNTEKYLRRAKRLGYRKTRDFISVQNWVDSIKCLQYDKMAIKYQSEGDYKNARKYALIAKNSGYKNMDPILDWVKEQTDHIRCYKDGVLCLGWMEYPLVSVETSPFMMGVPNDSLVYREKEWSDAKPQHMVNLNPYMLGKFEVTREMWYYVMDNDKAIDIDDYDKPINFVSWYDCDEFIKKLNALVDTDFRLPTEAEWEYAARGGRYSLNYDYSNVDVLNRFCVSAYNSVGRQYQRVGSKDPNELDIYDMLGNVSEWCMDVYVNNYEQFADTTTINPCVRQPQPDTRREYVARGGSFISKNACNVAYRQHSAPNSEYWGLRLAANAN